MQAPVERIRLSEKARYNLITIKRRTKIPSYNITCRWAFCLSLAEATKPSPTRYPADSNLEIAWKTFGGNFSDLFILALRQRVKEDGLPVNDEVLAEQFLAHLNRGIGYLAGDPSIRGIESVVNLAIKPPQWVRGRNFLPYQES
jgi:DNA sulfur modification protein DndE